MRNLPIVDVSALRSGDRAARARAANEIGDACREFGFFYATGHGIPDAAFAKLFELSHAFFALSEAEKMEIAMKHGGRAWRGYFPVEGELTSGVPDLKEGLYFGTELGEDDPRVQGGLPMHGANLFPARPRGLQSAVTTYINAATEAAHAIAEGIALSLGLDANYFREHYTYDPTVLFRIFIIRLPVWTMANGASASTPTTAS
jgi:isopenicillin N synthase-like dioxygenase